jgi:adenylosuccinate lyase
LRRSAIAAKVRRAALARELDLGPAVPGTQRDAIVEYGSWLALVAGSLGKMGQDLTLLAQTEVGGILESSDAHAAVAARCRTKPIRSGAR